MAFKMNGSPAKLGTIKGTTGHSSALKQKKREDVLKKKVATEKIKAEQDFMGKKNWTENELIKMGPEKRKKLMDLMKKGSANAAITKIKGIMDKVKPKSPAKQEGPVDKKQLPLQEGEMEGTAVYNPSEDKTMSKSFVNRERIADLEDRAEYARSDAESAEGEEKKKHLANAKKLQQEADILRNRKPNKK